MAKKNLFSAVHKRAKAIERSKGCAYAVAKEMAWAEYKKGTTPKSKPAKRKTVHKKATTMPTRNAPRKKTKGTARDLEKRALAMHKEELGKLVVKQYMAVGKRAKKKIGKNITAVKSKIRKLC
jgi:hypothetical protein